MEDLYPQAPLPGGEGCLRTPPQRSSLDRCRLTRDILTGMTEQMGKDSNTAKTPLDREWPGRPTRRAFLAPRGFRERLALLIGPSLVERYDFELAAETKRSDAGWESTVEVRRVLHERTGRGQF